MGWFDQDHYVEKIGNDGNTRYQKYVFNSDSGHLEPRGLIIDSAPAGASIYESVELMVKARNETKDFGLASLSKEDFFKPDGTPLDMRQIINLIRPHVPEGTTDEDIRARAAAFLPKIGEVSEEEKGFAREGFQKDVYGISKDAGKAGAQARSAYGSGMGSQMRGAFAGMKDVTQQFKQAEQGYEQDIYGLEQKRDEEFEADISTFLGGFKEGGRVPSRQTFSQILSRIPDAGGS